MKINVLEVHDMDEVEVEVEAAVKEAWGKTNERKREANRLKTDPRTESKYVGNHSSGDRHIEEDNSNACAREKRLASEGNHESINEKREECYRIRLVLKKSLREIDRRKIVVKILLGNGESVEKIVRLYKNKYMWFLITFLWLICTINALSITFNSPLLPQKIYIFFQTCLAFNFVLSYFVFVQVDLVAEITRSFNFWFIFWNTLSLHVCMILLWGSSLDVWLIVIHSTVSIVLLIFYEAHSGKRFLVMKIATIIGFISYIPTFVVLLFNLVEFRYEKFYHKPSGLEIIDVRLQALDNMSTIMIYFIRIFYNNIIRNKSNGLTFLSNFYEIEHKNKVASLEGKLSCSNDSQIEENKGDNFAPNIIPMISVIPNLPKNDENGVGVGSNSNKINNEDKSDNRPDVQIKLKCNDIASKSKMKHMVVGILEEKVLEYDPNLTIHHLYVKDRLPTISKILRSKYYNMVGMGFSLASLLLSLIIAVGLDFGEPFLYFGTAVVLISILFITIQIVMTCNFFMASYLLRSFDYWFIAFLIFKVLITSGILCNWDVRVVSWFFAVYAFNWSIMVDAFHVKTRKVAYLVIVGALWTLTAAILCKLNIGKTFESDRLIRLEGLNPISPRITLSTSAFSIALFTFRFFWGYLKNPNRILFITENVQVKDISN